MHGCLLIVDVQRGFVNEFTAHIPAAVETLQMDYRLVYATRFYNPDPSFYRSLIGWNRLSRDSDDFELAFDPAPGTKIIDKQIYTCVDQAFLEELALRGVKSVDVCGIDTDICVTKCAVDLFEHGVVPRVLLDYCASTAGPEAHRHAADSLERFIGRSQVIR